MFIKKLFLTPPRAIIGGEQRAAAFCGLREAGESARGERELGRYGMKLTSAEAAKVLRKMNDDLNDLWSRESMSQSFVAAVSENVEDVRPEYDFAKTRAEEAVLSEKIRKLKHAINVFNSTTVIPEWNITIDEMLVLIPQLTRKRDRLSMMKNRLPKERVEAGMRTASNIIDYRYANYDIAAAQAEYDEASNRLAKAQTALDLVNSTVTFEVTL